MQQFSFAHNIFADGDPYLKGFFGLSLLPSAEARRNKSNYEVAVINILGHQYAKFVSSRVIMTIGQHPNRQVKIRPRPIADPDPEESEESRLYNAEAVPTNRLDAIRKGDKNEEDKTVGTGTGSDVVIRYNPGIYADAMGQAPLNLVGRSDYALLHELVHALGDVSGVNAKRMAGPAGYDNLEEFTAIVVANVYRSENGEGHGILVGGHGGQKLPLLLTGGQAFYNRYSSYMQQVCANHPRLAKELKQATGISHNPFVYCTGV